MISSTFAQIVFFFRFFFPPLSIVTLNDIDDNLAKFYLYL